MTDINLLPITKIPHAKLDLPGSKSIANRVLPLAAICSGTSIIHNVPMSEDVNLMLEALKELGVKFEEVDSSPPHEFVRETDNDEYCHSSECENSHEFKSYKIHGCDGVFPNSDIKIFCGNSGTTIRFLSAILSVMQGNYTLDGIERMRERPIRDLVLAIQQIGANISYPDNDGFPPIQITPFSDNNTAKISISGRVSSQYLTGILLATTLLKRAINIEVVDELISKPYVDITINLIKKFGIHINKLNDNNYQVDMMNPKNKLTAIHYTVEPDASSASYFLALGAITGEITINNLSESSLQGDKNFAHVLQLMGADAVYNENSITVKKGLSMQNSNKLNAIDINMEDMPDVAMTIAVLALFADGVTTITGIHSWKVKETDRILAMRNELRKLGADVYITDHSIKITPPKVIKNNVMINTYNDHRMAMCFSLLAAYGVAVTIKNAECVSKTFPAYFEIFHKSCYQ